MLFSDLKEESERERERERERDGQIVPSIKTIHQLPDTPSLSVVIVMYHFVIKPALYANSGSGSLPHSSDVPNDL